MSATPRPTLEMIPPLQMERWAKAVTDAAVFERRRGVTRSLCEIERFLLDLVESNDKLAADGAPADVLLPAPQRRR